MIVTDRVEHCKEMAHKISPELKPKILTGEIKGEERRKIIESIETGETKVLIATIQLVCEGLDIKLLSSLFLTTPIRWEPESGRLFSDYW